jgi:serine/threonine protein kinase
MLKGARDTLGEQNSDGTMTLYTGPQSRLPTAYQFREFLAGADSRRINIGPYEADGIIGHGAMGIVVKAYDPALCRYVALKMLAPELAKCPKSRQRFAQEGRFAAALRHPNVVSVYGVSEMEGIPYLVMEYISGQSLQQLLDLGKKFTASEIARIGRETALGLCAAHDLRLIHRDIKPANLLVENNTGNVRIADFGLARDLDHDANISQKGMLVGTPLFMSPEQVDGNPLTPASDLFSLGSVLYTLCTKQAPFSAESLSRILCAIAEKHPTPIHVHNPDIPDGLACAINNLLSKEPLQRYTAGAFAECLVQWEHENTEIQLTV